MRVTGLRRGHCGLTWVKPWVQSTGDTGEGGSALTRSPVTSYDGYDPAREAVHDERSDREASAKDSRSMPGFAQAGGIAADTMECWMTKECTPMYRLELQ